MSRIVVSVCVVSSVVVLISIPAQSAPSEPGPDPAPQGILLIPEAVFLCAHLTVTVPSDNSHHTWVTIDWGDGTVDEWMDIACGMGCTGRFPHTYTSPGSYPITATHQPGGAVSGTHVEVTDSPEFSLFAYAQEEKWIQLASFDSLHTDQSYVSTIDWGDGTPAEEFRWRSCDGGSRCTPIHEYGSDGEYPVVARILYLDTCDSPCYERTATFQAVISGPNPVERSTWGAIKALYRRDF